MFWSTSSTFKASSAYKAIKILLVVSELLTKPHSLLLCALTPGNKTQTRFHCGCVTTVQTKGLLTASPPEALKTRGLFSFTRTKNPKKTQPPARNYFQCQILGLENQIRWFFLSLFLICLLFSAFASHLSRKIPTSDISKHFSGATVYKLPQHSTDTNFLCSLNAEFITRH